MPTKCPKCGVSLSGKKGKIQDANLLGLVFLFGEIGYNKRKKSFCDLCGSKIKKR